MYGNQRLPEHSERRHHHFFLTLQSATASYLYIRLNSSSLAYRQDIQDIQDIQELATLGYLSPLVAEELKVHSSCHRTCIDHE
jgi:hypothetical protein